MNIHVYPGMGATKNMFKNEWLEQDWLFHNWPEWNGESTIEELAAKVIIEHNIKPADIIIGTSLGGIVATEIANQIDIQHLVLIGSAKDKNEISSFLKVLHPLINYTPIEFIKALAGKIPMDLSIMFNKADPRFIRSMCNAIFLWEGLIKKVPTTRLHGTRDLVIPKPDHIDVSLNGGHLIAMTHAKECIEAIKNSIKPFV